MNILTLHPHKRAPLRLCQPLLFALSLLSLMILAPSPTLGQQVNGSLYEPISYAASSILADGGFYLYGGVTLFSDGVNRGTKQFLRLDLTKSFNTTAPPWTALPGHLTYTMIDAVPSQSGQQLILGGNRDNLGPLAQIYDVGNSTWTTSPALPGMVAPMTGYKRGNVGMALDPRTGLIYVYGGFRYLAFSNELSVLDTTLQDPIKMDWTQTFNQTTIPALYGAYLLYLPTVKKTIVMGGADFYNVASGLVGGCPPLSNAFLISGGKAKNDTVLIEERPLESSGGNPLPLPRYQSCRVVLENGDVFMQGGRDPNVFFGDAWILQVASWSWKPVTIQGPAASMTRAGHTCQLGPNGQVLLVGGFIKVGNASTFVTPHVAVIDTRSWTFTTEYKGAPVEQIWHTPEPEPSTDQPAPTGGLSTGAMAGLGVGVVVLLLLIGLGVVFWKRQKQRDSGIQGYPLQEEKPGHHEPETFMASAHSVGQIGDVLPSSTDHTHVYYPPPQQQDQHYPLYPQPSYPQQYSQPQHSHRQYQQQHAASDHSSSTSLPSSDPVAAEATGVTSAPLSTQTTTFLPAYNKQDSVVGHSGEKGSTNKSSNKVLSKLGLFSSKAKTSVKATEAAMAAAMLEAEDKASTGHALSPSASSFPPAVVQSVAGEPSTVYVSDEMLPTTLQQHHAMFACLEKSPASATSTTAPFSTSVSSLDQQPRLVSGPQSVPEFDARIERSSPGVKVHRFRARDVDPEGLYPPLTPARSQSFSSIVVGGPVSPVVVGLAESAVLEELGEQDASTDEGSVSTAGVHSGPLSISIGGHFVPMTANKHRPGPQQPFRDPEMVKELDQISKMVEGQSGPKSPHAVVDPLDLEDMYKVECSSSGSVSRP